MATKDLSPKPARRASIDAPASGAQESFKRPLRASTFPAFSEIRAESPSDTESTSSSPEWADSRRRAFRKARTSPTGNLSAKSKRRQEQEEQADRFGLSSFTVSNDDYETSARVSGQDGRLAIKLKESTTDGLLSQALEKTIQQRLEDVRAPAPAVPTKEAAEQVSSPDLPPPKLNIVVMVIGSRGDVQPFIKLGKVLTEKYGHRVRIATHPTFKEFVEKGWGLEFFSIGGDPSKLMSFMVKNPGLLPKRETIMAGEVGKHREAMFEMFKGFWRSCVYASDDISSPQDLNLQAGKEPFIADAIIANPPSLAHIHCAERLGVPLHIIFTFPTTATQQFPHPLTKVKDSNVDPKYTNFLSYSMIDMMIWQGLGDLINKFRVKTLGLEQMQTLGAPSPIYRMRVPHTYLWSPALIPKPEDWGPETDVTGFVFLDLASSFEPPPQLTKFLEASPKPPIYIGFGSIVVDDPDRFTNIVFEAVKRAGVRALVSKGWGGLGSGETPEDVFMLENTPHDWLFPRVSAVIHHGGAGTTAIGIKCGKPTMIIPFFGDQPFWGAMVAKAGAGADPVPYKRLNAEKLAEGIKKLLEPSTLAAAKEMGLRIESEGDTAADAIDSFHRSLPLQGERTIRCSILEDRAAVWTLGKNGMSLSALAAEILVRQNRIERQDLRPFRYREWNESEGPEDPFTGAGLALASSLSATVRGVGRTFRWTRGVKASERKQQAEKAQKYSASGELRDDEEVGSMNAARAIASDTASGMMKTSMAIAKAPMDLSMAMAQGFHNVPRMYGDKTVRAAPRVKGYKSGFRAAGQEFANDTIDGFTGLVKLPYLGAKEEGAKGFFKGIGKGIGGAVFKTEAASIALVAYPMKGIHRELIKGRQPMDMVRPARIMNGQRAMAALTGPETDEVVAKVNQTWQRIFPDGEDDCMTKKERKSRLLGEHRKGSLSHITSRNSTKSG